MASANVFNVGSAKQNQMLSANVAAGKTKADKSDKVAVFSTIMNANYSTNPNVTNVMDQHSNSDAKNTDAVSANYERYQYCDKQIDPSNPIAEKIWFIQWQKHWMLMMKKLLILCKSLV